jgi:hypothetical protein
MYNIYDDFERVNESLAEVMEMSPDKLQRAADAASDKADAYGEIAHDAGNRFSRLTDYGKYPDRIHHPSGLTGHDLRTIKNNARDIETRKNQQHERFLNARDKASRRDTIKGLRSGGKRYSLI